MQWVMDGTSPHAIRHHIYPGAVILNSARKSLNFEFLEMFVVSLINMIKEKRICLRLCCLSHFCNLYFAKRSGLFEVLALLFFFNND